jgi:hypothetical protein
LRNIIAPKDIRKPVYDFGMGFKIRRCKNKGGTGGLGKPHVPPQVENTGERLGYKTKSVPPKRRRKVLVSFYKIIIKKVLI